MSKLYRVSPEKARTKTTTKKSIEAREKRRRKALEAFSALELLTHFKLVENDAYRCPECKEVGVKVTKDKFSCGKCKSKGHTVKLAKLVLQTTDWNTIKYIEELSANKTNCKPVYNDETEINKTSCKPVYKTASEANTKNIPEETTIETETLDKSSVSETTLPTGTKAKTKTDAEKTTADKTNCKPVYNSTSPTTNQKNKIILNQIPTSEKITTPEIEAIKKSIEITNLVEKEGIQLKKSGNNLIGLCPFHDDKTPSLTVTPSNNLWHCFGCGKGGSVIDWTMNSKKIDFRQAIQSLRSEYHSFAQKETTTISPPVQRASSPESLADDQNILDEVVNYYHEKLKNSPLALAYLKKRGIEKAIDKFKLGFADRTLGIKMVGRKEEKRNQLQRLGILRESGHEHFSGSLVIPVIDNGKIGEMYGRKINHYLRKGTPEHLYLKGAHVGVFNREGLGEETIIAESLIDALSFWVHGFHNTTASYGVGGFTGDILEALKLAQTKRVYIAYDNDEAGNKASVRLAGKLANAGIECLRVVFPAGVDANSFICENGEVRERLQQLLSTAVPLTRSSEHLLTRWLRKPENSSISYMIT